MREMIPDLESSEIYDVNDEINLDPTGKPPTTLKAARLIASEQAKAEHEQDLRDEKRAILLPLSPEQEIEHHLHESASKGNPFALYAVALLKAKTYEGIAESFEKTKNLEGAEEFRKMSDYWKTTSQILEEGLAQ